jgi:hypothetical protein
MAPWSQDKLERLRALVDEHGTDQWELVAEKLGHLNVVECRKKYDDTRTDVNKEKICGSEKRRLLDAFDEQDLFQMDDVCSVQNALLAITDEFEGRTYAQISNVYTTQRHKDAASTGRRVALAHGARSRKRANRRTNRRRPTKKSRSNSASDTETDSETESDSDSDDDSESDSGLYIVEGATATEAMMAVIEHYKIPLPDFDIPDMYVEDELERDIEATLQRALDRAPVLDRAPSGFDDESLTRFVRGIDIDRVATHYNGAIKKQHSAALSGALERQAMDTLQAFHQSLHDWRGKWDAHADGALKRLGPNGMLVRALKADYRRRRLPDLHTHYGGSAALLQQAVDAYGTRCKDIVERVYPPPASPVEARPGNASSDTSSPPASASSNAPKPKARLWSPAHGGHAGTGAKAKAKARSKPVAQAKTKAQPTSVAPPRSKPVAQAREAQASQWSANVFGADLGKWAGLKTGANK